MFFLPGIMLFAAGVYFLYTNGLQLTKGNAQSHYKHIHVRTLPAIQSKPIYLTEPAEGENFGTLDIPALHMNMPLYEGTDKAVLRKGVGHYKRSVLPGQANNCVLSGHNDSVFRRLDELQKGDDVIIETSAGVFTYRVTDMRITDRSDKTVIVPKSKAILTLTTCYPFRYIGYTTKRYIVEASLIAQFTKNSVSSSMEYKENSPTGKPLGEDRGVVALILYS